MADYITTAEARAYAYQSVTADDAILGAILTRVSRIFDTYCGLPPNYFAKGDPVQVASARKFWGDGTDYLKLDPLLSTPAPTISMPSGFTNPPFLQSNPYQNARLQQIGEFFLVRVYGDNESRYSALNEGRDYFFAEFANQVDYVGFPAGIRVTVTAKWGWDNVPDDVKEAVLETTVAIFRNKDQAFARVVNLETSQVFNDVMPPKAKMIADRYRLGKAMFA